MIFIVAAFIGSLLYRMRGDENKWIPRFLEISLFCLIYPISLYFMGIGLLHCAIAWISSIAGAATGHGGGMDLGTNPKEPRRGRDPEKIEYLILWLHPRIKRYWYDALLLALTGLAVTAGPSFIMAVNEQYIAALLLILSGALKAPAYMMGRAVWNNTESGEYLTGAFLWGSMAVLTQTQWS